MFRTHVSCGTSAVLLRGRLRLWKVSVGYPAVSGEGASRPPMPPAPDLLAQKLSWESVARFWGVTPPTQPPATLCFRIYQSTTGGQGFTPANLCKNSSLLQLVPNTNLCEKCLCKGFLCVTLRKHKASAQPVHEPGPFAVWAYALYRTQGGSPDLDTVVTHCCFCDKMVAQRNNLTAVRMFCCCFFFLRLGCFLFGWLGGCFLHCLAALGKGAFIFVCCLGGGGGEGVLIVLLFGRCSVYFFAV